MDSQGIYMDSQGIYMASEGIYMTSQGIYMASEGINMASEGIYMPSQGIYVYRTEREKRGGIFIIYMGCRRAIYNNIASSTSVFFRPWIKNTLAGPCPRAFLNLGRKKPRFRGYTVV